MMIFGALIGFAGVLQLQKIAFELLSAPDDASFYLGLFYLAIVIFIWASTVYIAADYFIKFKKGNEPIEKEQPTSNEQKPNN